MQLPTGANWGLASYLLLPVASHCHATMARSKYDATTAAGLFAGDVSDTGNLMLT